MSTRKDSYWKLILSICICICISSLSNTLDYLFVTHPSYEAKYVAASKTYLLGFYDYLSNMNGKITDIDRSTFDARCRRTCLQSFPPGLCKVAQTCWQRGNLTCILYQVNACSQCQLAILANQTAARFDCHIWEINLPTDPDPTKACAEYDPGTFKGDCAYCGKRGYDRGNCSQPSTCAAQYYNYRYDLRPPFFHTCVINPCFTNGTAMNAFCFGAFTMWWSLSFAQGVWQERTYRKPYDAFLVDLPQNLNQLARHCSTGNSFRLKVLAGPVGALNYAIYSGVSIGVDWSLTIMDYEEGNFTSTLQLPIVNAPFLKPVNSSCGPMWLIEKNVFFNETHIDSCALNHTLLAPSNNKWGGRAYNYLSVFLDVEIFKC